MKVTSSDYLTIQDEWYSKIAMDGFIDIEDRKGNLKQYDRRTIAWENREAISEFFRALDHYLTEHPLLPPLDRQILSLYSEGVFIKEISDLHGVGLWLVKKVINKYKKLILTWQSGPFSISI